MSIQNQAYTKINQIKLDLSSHGISCGSVDKRQYNYEFAATENSEKLKVQVYFGKKGVKTVIQGNADLILYSKIDSILTGGLFTGAADNSLDEPEIYIGSDETGKGDFFGPLTVAAVHINKEKSDKLKKIGVCDSKELNDLQINKLAVKIKDIIDGSYEVIVLEPEVYNKLYEKFNNLNKMLDAAHSEVINKLLEKYDCKNVIIDKFCKNELMVVNDWKPKGIKFVQITKAERYTAVAAASIIARAAFNKWFSENTDEGVELPKGASLNVEKFASEKRKNFGLKYFENKAKLHFKTINKI